MSFLNTFGPFQTLPWYTPHTLPFQHEYPGCFYVIPVTLAPQPTQILFPHPEVLEAEPSTQPILTTEKRDCLVETSTETDGLFKRNISRPKSIEKCRERRFERNVITNIGNQLLTFLRMRRKNQAVLFRIAPELTEKQLARYYLFAQKIKNSMHSYVSFDKLASIWHVDSETEEERLFRQIIRKLSQYYLRQPLVLAVMTSKKMSAGSRPMHLRLRRSLLTFLKGK